MRENIHSSAQRHISVRDHLGNVRVVFDEDWDTEQVTHYYPFGGIMAESSGQSVQPWKYGGKELDRTHGLDAYDFGARTYFADRMQWGQMDPLCEKYYSISPYAYCGGNPVIYKDILGLYISTDVKKNRDGTYTVVNAHNDGDCNIYVVDNNMRRTGEIIGVTIQPFDFMDTNNRTGEFYFGKNKTIDLKHLTVSGTIRPIKDLKIPFINADASKLIQSGMTAFSYVQYYKSSGSYVDGLYWLAKLSKNGAPLDIKASLDLDAYTAIKARVTSKGLPVITTLRAVGNMLFGANLRSIKPRGYNESFFYSFIMPLVGSYNQKTNRGNGYNMSSPYYGEHEYSGSYIQYGYYGHF